MKYCKKCGVLYSDLNACCPKCNTALTECEAAQESAPEADKRTRRRQWIALCVGIPGMILVFYILFWLARSAMQ